MEIEKEKFYSILKDTVGDILKLSNKAIDGSQKGIDNARFGKKLAQKLVNFYEDNGCGLFE